MYLAPQNISRAIGVLTLGNKVILHCIELYCIVLSRLKMCMNYHGASEEPRSVIADNPSSEDIGI